MGLREVNAERTRQLLLDTALALFQEQGYDATRMEQIAESAGVGTSTLYRYFPSKELLATEPLAVRGQMAEELRVRPEDEPLDVALGHAVLAILLTPRVDAERLHAFGVVVNSTPNLRLRMIELGLKERDLLQAAIAERLNLPPDDLYCVTTARQALMVVDVIADLLPATQFTADTLDGHIRAKAEHVLAAINTQPPALPRIGETAQS